MSNQSNQASLINIATLPTISLSDRASLPSCSGIYFLLSSKGKLLYIGRSINIANRWRNGHHQHRLRNRFKNLWLAWYESDIESLETLEAELINCYNPPFNGDSRYKPKTEVHLTVELSPDKVAILHELSGGNLDTWLTQHLNSFL